MLERLHEQAAEHALHKSDFLVNVHEVEFSDQYGILVPTTLFNSQTTYAVSDWALQQACDKLGPPPKRYIEQCPGWLAGRNLNYWRERLPEDQQWLIRAYDEGCRAILSKEYSVLNNDTMLQWIIDYNIESYAIVRPYLDAHTLHLKIRIVNSNLGRGLGDYGFGVYIGNGEIGNRAIRVWPFIQRHSCENSIIMAKNGYHQQHRFRTPKMIEAEVKTHMADGLRLATDQIDALYQAAIDELPDFNHLVSQLCRNKGFNEETKLNIMRGTEGQATRLGLVNGLSWAAHQQPDYELQIDMEAMAGAALVEPDSLFGMAARRLEPAVQDAPSLED